MLEIRLQEVAGYLQMEMVLVPNEGEDEKAVRTQNYLLQNLIQLTTF